MGANQLEVYGFECFLNLTLNLKLVNTFRRKKFKFRNVNYLHNVESVQKWKGKF